MVVSSRYIVVIWLYVVLEETAEHYMKYNCGQMPSKCGRVHATNRKLTAAYKTMEDEIWFHTWVGTGNCMFCNGFNLWGGLGCVEGVRKRGEFLAFFRCVAVAADGPKFQFVTCHKRRCWFTMDGTLLPLPRAARKYRKYPTLFSIEIENGGKAARKGRLYVLFSILWNVRFFDGPYNYARFPISFCFCCLLLQLVLLNEQSTAIYSRRNNLKFSWEKFNIYCGF